MKVESLKTDVPAEWNSIHVNTGETLGALSQQAPQLIVFLRHSGCSFCRETLARLQEIRQEIESSGVKIVLVHLMSDPEGGKFFATYGLDDVPRISDPDGTVYRLFGLERGSLFQVLGPQVWWKGFRSVILKGHLPGKPVGDVLQLPGTFVVYEGKIVAEQKAENSAEQPDFADLLTCAREAMEPAEVAK